MVDLSLLYTTYFDGQSFDIMICIGMQFICCVISILFVFSVRSPDMPQYSLNNLNPQPSLTLPNASLMMGSMSYASELDTNTTLASTAGMPGGTMQYTPVTNQQPVSQPQVQPAAPGLNNNAIQLLLQSGLLNSNQQNQQAEATASVQQPAVDTSTQNEVLKQLLVQVLANQLHGQGQQVQPVQQQHQNTLPVNTGDPNMQSVEMPSLGSLDQNYLASLMTGESPMTSLAGNFGSFDGLANADLDCDPNVAGFETVGGE